MGESKDSVVAAVPDMENMYIVAFDAEQYPVTADHQVPDAALYILIFWRNRASFCQSVERLNRCYQ